MPYKKILSAPQRLRCPRALTSLLLLALSTASGAEETTETRETEKARQPSEQCQSLLPRGDPALFQFVETREKIDYDQYKGMPIKGIDYEVLPIFDPNNPDENYAIYRLFNFLHIDTKPGTLEKQMLLSPGEPLNPDELYENERQLRENGYLVDAMIVPEEVCDDGIRLRTVVRDVWTLYASGSASRSGGDNSVGAGLTENNLFGLGQELSVGYYENDDRDGYGFSYYAPDLITQHLELALDYYDNSDGDELSVNLKRPFYKLDSRWGAGASTDQIRLTENVERDDVVINRYQRESINNSAFWGWSAGLENNEVHRWRIGYTEQIDEFTAVMDPSSPPDDVELRYPWVNWEYLQDRFWTTSNITRSHRQEDIPIGLRSSVTLGYASESAGSDRNAAIYNYNLSYSTNAGHSHLVRTRAEGSGRYNLDTDLPEEAIYSFNLDYFKFIDPNNRWFINLQYNLARNIRDDRSFTTGDGDALRGYPSDIQRGNHQWTFTAERRHFTDIHLLNLAWLGGAIYFDAGRTWDSDSDDPDVDERVLSNIGMGLRISPSKFRIDRVAHIDIAWPLDEGDNIDNYQILIKGRVDF
ncbi:hypothetical protein NCG89_09170 [Spongiibacter taiwanensis]|uniref:hypothetical protein n=1 Tax=Spongiibacter taiwanensis TaxID=1748242 RepID=UPI002034EC01|nr:hypothetical protein [Spongiibacter taiwanensis]USA41690.1 hypothetical protein NCG89_09170 [Spongiibacter taiwanensis]